MKGHQHVIDMRVQLRIKPDSVTVYTDDDPGPGWDDNPLPHYYKPHADIWVAEGESFARLDLRFMVGLQVRIHARSIPRMVEAMTACRKACAEHVIGIVYDPQVGRDSFYMQEHRRATNGTD